MMTDFKQPTTNTLPKTLLFDKWANIGFCWQGRVHTGYFERLSDLLQEPSFLDLSVNFTQKSGLFCLMYHMQGALILPCDRCMQRIAYNLPSQIEMYLLIDDSQIPLAGERDFILLSELNDKRNLPISDILEDELILSLPTAIYHDDCQMAVAFDELPKDNPFAVLSALKNQA